MESNTIITSCYSSSANSQNLELRTSSASAQGSGQGSSATSVFPSQDFQVRVHDIPPLPATLMIPPSSFAVSSAASAAVGVGEPRMTVSGAQGGSSIGKGAVDVSYLHHNLESMKLQVVREADVLHGLQSQLSVKEHEMERIRAELEQCERVEREALQGTQHSSIGQRGVGVQSTAGSSMFGAPLTSGGAIPRTVTMTTPSSGTKGFEFALQQYRKQTEDLTTRLKMTTELCAKQEAYYRDIVKELEDRLKETVSGRDHILSLRENEASNQMNLVRQLEGALRKQQQLSSEKDEAIESLERRVKHLDESYTNCSSILNKLRRVIHEEENKKGRPMLPHGYEWQGQEMPSNMGDTMVQTLQKCLFDGENEKKLLQSKLDRMETELKSTRNELQNKLDDLTREHEARISCLTADHSQALDIAASRSANSREELEKLQQDMELIKMQHKTEVSAMDDKMASLKLELEKVTKQRDEVAKEFETKCSDFQSTSHDIQVEVNLLREEKEKLLSNMSREQANIILLTEKLTNTEHELSTERERVLQLSEEEKVIQFTSAEEIRKLKAEFDERKSLFDQKEQELVQQAEQEIQNVTKVEQEKSNSRLNIMLFELNKLNVQVSKLTSEVETKDTELNTQRDENKEIKGSLKQRDKEISLMREEKIELATRFDEKCRELTQLQEELTSKVSFSNEKAKDLEEANYLIETLRTRLEEREKTISGFKEQGTNLAEILERNNQTGDSLQRERQELIQRLQEQIGEVQEMKRHREILAKKLKAKDKRVKELEEEMTVLQRTVRVKVEELAALTDDRENTMSELKARQMEVGVLREERDTLNAVLEGKDGEREKEISKLLSRLKGSEQDLSLTKKLLKAKGEMSGKAVRVAETMQRQITEKRGEVDSLYSKIHWLQESLDAAIKDKIYFESKSNKLSAELSKFGLHRDQLSHQSQEISDECEGYRKQANHLEQALEKAAIKHVDSQAVIEKLEQDIARLKLKHSLEMKELKRNQNTGVTSLKVDAATVAEILTRVNAGLRLPVFIGQPGFNGTLVPQKSPVMSQPITLQNVTAPPARVASQSAVDNPPKNEEVSQDLKCILQDVRTLISSFQAHISQSSLAATPAEPAAPSGPTMNFASIPEGPYMDRGGTYSTGAQMRIQMNPPQEAPYCRGAPLAVVPQYESIANEHFSDSNDEFEFKKDFDITRESMDNFRPPLGSSSPKPEKVSAFATSMDVFRSESPINISGELDDSDITSLLSGQQSSLDIIVTREPRGSSVPPSVKSGTGSSITSGQRSSASMSSRQIRKSGIRLSNKENVVTTGSRSSRRHDDEGHKKISKGGYTSGERGVEKKSGSALSERPLASLSPDSPPSYQRAEMILQSLVQTGSQLTKKNIEIAHLLGEQDRRIQRCRENELGIQSMLR